MNVLFGLLIGLIVGGILGSSGTFLWMRRSTGEPAKKGPDLARLHEVLEPIGALVQQADQLARQKGREDYRKRIVLINLVTRAIGTGQMADLIVLGNEMVRMLERWVQGLPDLPDAPPNT